MRARVQKWGNSLALRVPKSFASDTGLSQGSEVELSVENGQIVVKPISSWETRLKAMLDQITPENLHPEIDTGPPVGNEEW